MFITLEGPEGSGKTTQIELLVAWLGDQGYDVVLTREPGGTGIGTQIRDVLHDPANTAMAATAEILLYSADRAQHVAEFITPLMAEGKIVISDRYYDSTLAYQGYGRGLDLEALLAITAFATGGLKPDLTLYLDIAPEKGLERRQTGGGEWNRLDAEALEFHQRVREGYLKLIEQEPERWVVVDADGSVEEVQEEIREQVGARLGQVKRNT
jgi:dTMP kinase